MNFKVNKELKNIITHLRRAIKSKDKKAILAAYDKAEQLDLSTVDTKIFVEYDNLVTKANDILYADI